MTPTTSINSTDIIPEKKAYEPNTNQVLPVFRLTKYELINPNPGWLFTPREKYREDEVSYYPDLIPPSLR